MNNLVKLEQQNIPLNKKGKIFLIGLFLILVLLLVLLPLCSAQLFKQNTDVILRFTCTLNNAVPSALTTFNITLNYPNGSTYINNALTTPLGQGAFSYNTNFPFSGTYSIQQFCYDGAYSFSNSDNIIVTATGQNMDTSKAITYILIWIIGLIIFVCLIIISIALPSGNKRNEMTGYILDVNNLKYVKILSMGFAYLVAMFMAYFSWMMCYAYLDMNFLTSIFQFIFYAQLIALLPLFIVTVYLLISNWVRDSKIADLLSRGLKTK